MSLLADLYLIALAASITHVLLGRPPIRRTTRPRRSTR